MIVLTEIQQNFIRNNYNKMIETEIAKKLEIGRFAVQKFKRDNNLSTYSKNAVKRTGNLIEGEFFDYNRCYII